MGFLGEHLEQRQLTLSHQLRLLLMVLAPLPGSV
jgi:hypothetical protein